MGVLGGKESVDEGVASDYLVGQSTGRVSGAMISRPDYSWRIALGVR